MWRLGFEEHAKLHTDTPHREMEPQRACRNTRFLFEVLRKATETETVVEEEFGSMERPSKASLSRLTPNLHTGCRLWDPQRMQ